MLSISYKHKIHKLNTNKTEVKKIHFQFQRISNYKLYIKYLNEIG